MTINFRTWPTLEHDQNRGVGQIFDIVTAEHATEFSIGTEVMVVCLDGRGGTAADFGYGFLGVVRELNPLENGDVIVYAAVKEES